MNRVKSFIVAHLREVLFIVLAIVAYNVFPLDQVWNLVWIVVGLVALKQTITMFDRYWSRKSKGNKVSLSDLMSRIDPAGQIKIYQTILICASFIIGCAIVSL
jgi:hypothetical protein